MFYKDTGFRALYKEFTCFPIEAAQGTVNDFPGADEANCVLTYGYIDREAGLTLEILACGVKDGHNYQFFESAEDVRSFIRMRYVMDKEFWIIDSENSSMFDIYKDKIDALSVYDPENDEIEESRKMAFLDLVRNIEFPDDVQVYLLKNGLPAERCWARIIGLQKPGFIGELLTEPNGDFGFHQGEIIGMIARIDENENAILISDLNPDIELKREDMEDGKMLKGAIHTFNEEQTEPNFIEVLRLLRDSEVWIPCNAIISEEDEAFIEEQLNAAGGDIDTLSENPEGKTFVNNDPIRLVPDILWNGDDYFFPVFTSVEEMGKYGNHFSTVPDEFLHTVILARNNEKDVKGIVVNAFSEPFIMYRELFDVVENVRTRLA